MEMVEKVIEKQMMWRCKYCGETEYPQCHQCVREDSKPVTDELQRRENGLQP